MDNLDKEKAIEAKGYWHTIDNAVNYLIKCRNEGKSVYLVFNDVKLYSADVTLEDAYLQITGLTPNEFREAQEDFRRTRSDEERKEIIEKYNEIKQIHINEKNEKNIVKKIK